MRPQTLYDRGSRLGAEVGVKTASPTDPQTFAPAKLQGAPGLSEAGMKSWYAMKSVPPRMRRVGPQNSRRGRA